MQLVLSLYAGLVTMLILYPIRSGYLDLPGHFLFFLVWQGVCPLLVDTCCIFRPGINQSLYLSAVNYLGS